MYDVQNREEELVRLRKERDKLLTQVSKLSKLREKNAKLQRELGRGYRGPQGPLRGHRATQGLSSSGK